MCVSLKHLLWCCIVCGGPPKCLINTSRKVQSFVKFPQFVRVARRSEDSMCLHGFCFWWLPVVGVVCLGVRWWCVGGVQSAIEV